MTEQSLFDRDGGRKYLVARERLAFVRAAYREKAEVGSFCLVLAFTGARISEVLALTPNRIDRVNKVIVFETLKRRKRGVFRAVPVPEVLMTFLRQTHHLDTAGHVQSQRLWRWGRTTAWKLVREAMLIAGISNSICQPKALRHAFAVVAVQNGVPLNMVQRWLGHARIETTAIYASAVGDEERSLAKKAWGSLEISMLEFGTSRHVSNENQV